MRVWARSVARPAVNHSPAHYLGRMRGPLAGLLTVFALEPLAQAEPAMPAEPAELSEPRAEALALEPSDTDAALPEVAHEDEEALFEELPGSLIDIEAPPELEAPQLKLRRSARRWFRVSVLPTRWRKMPHGWVVQMGEIGVRWASASPVSSSLWAKPDEREDAEAELDQASDEALSEQKDYDPMESSLAVERLRRRSHASKSVHLNP